MTAHQWWRALLITFALLQLHCWGLALTALLLIQLLLPLPDLYPGL
jgi:hypothetical protein